MSEGRFDPWLALGAGIATLITAVVIVVILVGGAPVPGLSALLILGILLLIAGQFRVMFIVLDRRRQITGSWRGKTLTQRGAWTLFFAGLPAPVATSFLGLFFLGWVAGVTAATGIGQGNPEAAKPGCPWPLDDHGVISCVSHATYQHAGAAVERFAAGILMAFFAMHCGVLLSEVLRRRAAALPS